MSTSEMCGSTSAVRDRGDDAAAGSPAYDPSPLASHDESAGSWEQAWIDLGGEG